MYDKIGEEMYQWATDLFPWNRSITGQPVRDTLQYIKEIVPELTICEIASGTAVFDWIVPDEWSVTEAYITTESGEKIIDFKDNNLHLISYSVAVDQVMELDELDNFLHSIPEQPDAIPYITSYYKKKWGFCISHNKRIGLEKGRYHVCIKSEFKKGFLNYGEVILKGKTDQEILLSTYICHPSMANNELSGIVVTTALTRWLAKYKDRYYTYRILFIPETIGSIAYLSSNWVEMKKQTIAGYVITCVGDNRSYSFMPSRLGNTLADKIVKYVFATYIKEYNSYSFLLRGSDERQFCSPLIDLPVASIMRSKYATYPEYHTSLDNLDLINPEGLEGAFNVIQKCLEILEVNFTYKAVYYCEAQLGKRGLYNVTSNQDSDALINLLAYADGKTDLLDISEIIQTDFFECASIARKLEESVVIEKS